MTLKTLKYTAHTTRAGYRQLEEAFLLFGVLYNALITHRRSRSSTHRHVKYLNIQYSHITDFRGEGKPSWPNPKDAVRVN